MKLSDLKTNWGQSNQHIINLKAIFHQSRHGDRESKFKNKKKKIKIRVWFFLDPPLLVWSKTILWHFFFSSNPSLSLYVLFFYEPFPYLTWYIVFYSIGSDFTNYVFPNVSLVQMFLIHKRKDLVWVKNTLQGRLVWEAVMGWNI